MRRTWSCRRGSRLTANQVSHCLSGIKIQTMHGSEANIEVFNGLGWLQLQSWRLIHQFEVYLISSCNSGTVCCVSVQDGRQQPEGFNKCGRQQLSAIFKACVDVPSWSRDLAKLRTDSLVALFVLLLWLSSSFPVCSSNIPVSILLVFPLVLSCLVGWMFAVPHSKKENNNTLYLFHPVGDLSGVWKLHT